MFKGLAWEDDKELETGGVEAMKRLDTKFMALQQKDCHATLEEMNDLAV